MLTTMIRPRCSNLMLTAALLTLGVATFSGCGTTRSSDTVRTATEQLLLSDAIDRAVQTVNFASLAGQTVYLDDSRLQQVVDKDYLISTLRQHLLASGCALRDKRDDADFIVEARAGAVGTDRSDLLFGVPSMNVPQIVPLQPVPAAIPEIPIAKRRDQRGIVKLAVFAYHRETGAPVWQSGTEQQESSSNDVWILGAGPFQRGSVSDEMEFAGRGAHNGQPSHDPLHGRRRSVDLAREANFMPADRLAKLPKRLPAAQDGVLPASHETPVADPPQPREPRPFPEGDTEPLLRYGTQ
jgi:Family of unknown function (DUF6655)